MEFHDVPIIKETQLAKLDWDGILITGLDNLEHAQARLMELGINKKSVWSLS